MIYTAKEAFLTIQGEGGQAAGGLRASPAAIGGTVSSGIALAPSARSAIPPSSGSTAPAGAKLTTAQALTRHIETMWRGGR